MDEKMRELRQLFLPIAVVEHLQMLEPVLTAHELAGRLGQLWQVIRDESLENTYTLTSDCIFAIHKRVAKAFDAEPGAFQREDDWSNFVEACGSIQEDPGHVISWIFSSLYWRHLTKYKLATAWLYVNALRIQSGLPDFRLSLDRLGPFLVSLSASGPPTNDGQTFYPDDYVE